MEIERKFWLDRFPENLPMVKHLQTWQGYLYTDPAEVRIRRSRVEETGEEYYRLCIKSQGDLARHEVETPLTKAQFEELCLLLEPGKPLIHKDYRAYDLGDGLTLECSVVDEGAFSYAEVEFESEAAAKAWQPLPCLGRETTYESGFKMKRYWHDRSLAGHTGGKENKMDYQALLSHVDHTLLTQTATWEEIRNICDDGVTYGCASVCIPASYVAQAAAYLQGRCHVCTVIGFPNGYSTTASKVFEAEDAVKNGADEVDMVINIGWAKDGRWSELLEEIRAVKAACGGKVLKVIVETCLLTEEEKIRLCEIVSQSGADYIKTSTGFSTAGATKEDVALFAKHVAPHVKIKAAGGIASLQDAQDFLDLGADRLGTSRIVKLIKGQEAQGY